MSTAAQSDDDWLIDDEGTSEESSQEQAWKVLIVDDEPDVHSATRLAIKETRYKDRSLELMSAYSGQEGFDILKRNPDIALILLDVVMESDDAGLKLVKRIREEMGNHLVRIILRTGQPGQAPEQEVILNYDINDYKTKTELTVQRLFTTVVASLRAFESLITIEKSRQGLSKILTGASDLYQLHSLREFASGVLDQIGALLDSSTNGVLCIESGVPATPEHQLEVLAATGVYEYLLGDGYIKENDPLYQQIHETLEAKHSVFNHDVNELFVAGQNAREFVVHFSRPWELDDLEKSLLGVFCERISAAYDNLYLYNQLLRAQQATVVALADLAEFRDTDTGEHVLRVQRLTHAIAHEIYNGGDYHSELNPHFLEMVGMASILHDIGKVGTPDHILLKPGRLDPDERVIMEQHATIGAQILAKAAELVEGTTYLSLGSEIAGGHHEHWDGNGYPRKLQGKNIPLSARIVAIVDVFDALLHKRPYKEPWPLPEVTDYIRSRSGTQFDPVVVKALLKLIDENRLPISLPT